MKSDQNLSNKMSRKLTLFSLLGLMTIIFSCESATSSDSPEDQSENSEQTEINSNILDESVLEAQTETDLVIPEEEMIEEEPPIDLSFKNFIKEFNSGNKLSPFFADNWSFGYYTNDRSDGTTSGEVNNLKNTQVDEIINVNVASDGEGWEPTEPRNYVLKYNLKEEANDWGAFAKGNLGPKEKNVVYISPNGVDYVYFKIYYNDKNLITKLEYSGEDPG